MSAYQMDKITTTIKRQWLREIAAGRKRIEYREIKPYWTHRFSRVDTPFLLRLINGMGARTPELTVIVRRIRRNSRSGNYELVLGKVVALKYWNRRLERPAGDPLIHFHQRRRRGRRIAQRVSAG
jgi:hypothetical protein